MSTADAPLAIAPVLHGRPAQIIVVRAPYYRSVVDGMTQGAQRILAEAGATAAMLDVAGAFELPQAIRIVAGGRIQYDGYVALGCVVRGETDHYDFICAATMQGLMQVALDHALCLGSGLLTVDTLPSSKASARKHGLQAKALPATPVPPCTLNLLARAPA